MDDSGDAGFEFIGPTSLADAKNKIAKMMMFYLGDIGREFDLARWNDAEKKRIVKASSYFFKRMDNWTVNLSLPETSKFKLKNSQSKPVKVESVMGFEVVKELDMNVKTLNEWR